MREQREEIDELRAALKEQARLVSELRSLYSLDDPAWLREGITFGDSFAELIAGIFGSELILVDALLPELLVTAMPAMPNWS